MVRLISEEKNKEGKIRLKMNPIGALFSESDYIIELRVCGDPLCNCGASNIILTKEENLGKEDIEYNLPIDVHKEEVRSKYNKEFYSKKENQGFITGLLKNGLTSEDWFCLRKEYFKNKFIVGEQVNPDLIKFEFEKEDYEDVTLMFPYYHAFPCSSFSEQLDNKNYLIFDTYCKNPECECGDMLLEVYEVPEKDKEDKSTKSIGRYFYNYESNKSSIEGGNKTRIELIIKQIFKKHPDFNELFRRRNQVIRKIYAKSKNKYNLEKINQIKPSNKKIGRNELCPCGSGKKYKKCCLL